MPPPSDHPPASALAAFALGKLDSADAAPIENHLAACGPCVEEAAAVPPDTLVEAVAAGLTLATPAPADAPTPTYAFAPTPSLGGATLGWGGPDPGPAAADAPAELRGHPKYRVVRRLGAGGMGTVWLARHEVMHRDVAVKVIRPELLARPGAVGRFLREVRAAGRLHHPNIVTAFDAEPAGDSCLLAMEYVDGPTLAELVAAGPLPPAEAVRAVRDAARGLAHAHATGLIHRDVKPHNLVRAADGTVKVLDFGLAGVGAGEVVAAGDGLTGAGMVVGTPEYIAPEQVADPHAADARADVYGLGCTFYHLLAGRPPVSGGSIMDRLTAQQTRAPDPIPGLAADLAAVLAKMLAKRPEDRYQSADEVVAALDAVTDAWRAPARPRRSGRRALLVATGLMLALAAMFAAVVYKIERDNEEVVITTDDPDIEVVMLRKGELVRIRDPKTGQTWEIDPFARELGLVDRPEGLRLNLAGQEPFVLKRDGREVFRVTRQRRVGPAPPVSTAARPFVIPAAGARPDQPHSTLAEAVAAAGGGDTIEVRGNGPFVSAPIAIQGKPLTLRAGAGFRPVVQLSAEGEKASAPLLKTDAALTLEGLDLQYAGAGNKFRPAWPLVHTTAPLAAANCRFLMACERPAYCVLADGCPSVELRNCELLMLGFNFAVMWNCPPDGTLVVENCVHLGRSLLNVDHRDNRRASVRLARNTVVGYGEVAVVTLATWPDPADRPLLGFEMTGNATETDQVMTCTHDPDHTLEQVRTLLPRFVRWQDRDNVYGARNAMLAHYHVRQAATEYLVPGRTVADWEAFWKLDKTGSTAADALRFEGGKGAKDFRAKLADGSEHLTPADFRLAGGSPGQGADLGLVGPGAGYERWKATPAYQAWRIAHAPPADTGVVVPRLVQTTDTGSPVRSLGYTPSGGTLVVGGNDLRLFDRATNSEVHRAARPGNVTAAVALSADGKTAAAASQGTVLLFDLDNGRRLKEVPIQSKNGFTFSLALSHDARTLAYSADGAVRLVDLATDKTDTLPAAQKGSPFGVGFSADGRYLVYTADELVTILDAKTRAVVEKRHLGTVGLSAISGDGRRLVVTSGMGTPEFSAYPLPSGERYRESNLSAGIGALAVSADGGRLALGLVNGSAQVWDLQRKKLVASWDVRDPAQQKGPFSHTAVAITPDGRTLATGAGNTFRVWDLTGGPGPAAAVGEVRRLEGQEAGVRGVLFTRDGLEALTCGDDGRVRVWDVRTGARAGEFVGPGRPVPCAAVHPEKGELLTGGEDGVVRLWDLTSGRAGRPGREVRQFVGHDGPVRVVAFSPDGKRALSAGQDATVRVWDVAAKEQLRSLELAAPATGAAFTPDGKRVFASAGEMIHLFDVAGNDGAVGNRQSAPSGVRQLSLAADGRRLLFAAGDGKARLLDFTTAAEAALQAGVIPRWEVGAGSGPVAAVLSPDGRRALTGGADGVLRLWDADTGKEAQAFPGHAGGVRAVAFSPDGRSALSAAGDATVRLWRLPDPPAGDGWLPLFNRKDLSGWRPVGGTPATWRVENGVLRGAGAAGALVSDRPLGDFELQAEVRLSPGASWALGFRSDPPAGGKAAAGLAADFVYKGQTNDVAGHMRMETTLTRDGEPLAKFVGNVKPNDWFPVELTVRGDRATVRVPDGGVGASGLPQPLPRGPLVLRLLDPNSVLEVRNLTVRELAPPP